MALTGQELQDKLIKDATRLFAFSEACPRDENPYRFKALLMVEALASAKEEIIAKNPKNRFLNDFIPSIIKQYKDKGYLSNRQVEVVEGVLEKNGFDVEAIREAAKRETEAAFIELQKAHAVEINGVFFQKAKFEYEAYCEQCKAQAARRWHRRPAGSYQYKTY